MPIYEYQCSLCGRIEECLQKIDDPAPICHQKSMDKLISVVNTRKGAGLWSYDPAKIISNGEVKQKVKND